jgi:TrmH family RNA methyltransferase
VLAVVSMQEESAMPFSLNEGFFIGLENLQDPGNMGTIIRSAEWFGVKAIFCTENTVDIYNPKVVQASMGSVFRIPVLYLDLNRLLLENTDTNSYAAVLEGKNVYETTFSKNAILLIGNESKGLSSEIVKQCKYKITIPSFGKADSLNAAVACSVLLGFMRS